MSLDSYFGERNTKQKYLSHMSLDSRFGERNTKQKCISKVYDHHLGRSILVQTFPKNVLGYTSESKKFILVRTFPKNVLGYTSESKKSSVQNIVGYTSKSTKSFVISASFYDRYCGRPILVRTFPKNVLGYTSKSKKSRVFHNFSPHLWFDHFPKCPVCRAFASFLSHCIFRAVALARTLSRCRALDRSISYSFVVIYFPTPSINIKSFYSNYCHFSLFNYPTLDM